MSDEARSPLSGHASSGMTSFGLGDLRECFSFLPPAMASVDFRSQISFLLFKIFGFCFVDSGGALVTDLFVLGPSLVRSRAACSVEKSPFLGTQATQVWRHPAFLFGVETDCTSGHKRTNGFEAQIIPDSPSDVDVRCTLDCCE